MNFRRTGSIKKPSRAHTNDAGWDLHAPCMRIIPPHSISERIDMKVGFEIPKGFCGFVTERSSQGARGISVIGPVVDSGYTGNVHATIVNNSDHEYEFFEGDRICQMLVLAVNTEELEEVEVLEGERGTNSHGSSGI